METRVLTLFDDEFFPQEPPKEKPKKEKAAKAAVSAAEEAAAVEPAAEPVRNEPEVPIAEPAVFPEEDMPVTAFGSERLADDKVPVNEAVIVSYEDAIMQEAIDESANDEPEVPVSEPSIFSEEDMPVTAFESERLVDDKVPVDEMVTVHYTDATAYVEPVHEGIDNEPELLLGENDTTIDTEPSALNEDAPVTEQAFAEPSIEGDRNKELNQQILSELIQLDYTALMQKNYAFDLNNATVINKELPKRNVEPVAEPEVEAEREEEEVFEEIIPLPEWNLDKKYYTIGEVAQLFSVNTSHIRFWTNEFKLRPRTTRKGDRLYSPKDIAELRLIHHLVKEKKHTIKGAREKLKAEKADVNNKLDLKESLVQLRDTLLKIKEQL